MHVNNKQSWPQNKALGYPTFDTANLWLYVILDNKLWSVWFVLILQSIQPFRSKNYKLILLAKSHRTCKILKPVHYCVYLGRNLFTCHTRCDKQIMRIISMATSIFMYMDKVLLTGNLSRAITLNVFKCYVWLTLFE